MLHLYVSIISYKYKEAVLNIPKNSILIPFCPADSPFKKEEELDTVHFF